MGNSGTARYADAQGLHAMPHAEAIRRAWLGGNRPAAPRSPPASRLRRAAQLLRDTSRRQSMARQAQRARLEPEDVLALRADAPDGAALRPGRVRRVESLVLAASGVERRRLTPGERDRLRAAAVDALRDRGDAAPLDALCAETARRMLERRRPR